MAKAMSFCVPDWDGNGFLGDFSSNTRGKWEAARPISMESPFVPDDEFEELCWEDGQLMLVMPSQNNRPPHKQLSSWAASVSPLNKPVSRDQVDASLYMGDIATNHDETLDAVVDDGDGSRVAGFPPAISDDEMIAWLQYPLDDELRVDDSDPVLHSGHHAVSYLPSLPFQKSDSVHRNIGAMQRERPSIGITKGKQAATTTNTDLAQAIARRGSQTESFSASFGNSTSALTTDGATSDPKPGTQYLEQTIFSSKAASLLPPLVGSPYCSQQSDPQKILQSISRPVTDMKPATGVPNWPASLKHVKHIDRGNVEVCMSTDSSIESTITGRSLQEPLGDRSGGLTGPNVSHCMTATTSTLHQLLSVKGPDAAACIDDFAVCSETVVADIPSGSKLFCSADANQTVEKGSGAFESTDTSCAAGSGNTTATNGGKVDSNGSYGKRKVKDLDDSESQSEDLGKQPPLSQATSTKRGRAAEVHNNSERKRRERINEKLKALQELIPNANKTDKASMLGEAIEYLKALQSHILVMSYRTGITIPPMLISHGLPHPHVPPHAGIGFGAGMGVKTGVMDMSAATSTCSMPKALALGCLIPSVTIPALSTPATNVATLPQNGLSRPVVGYSTNYFPFSTFGAQPFLVHTNQLQNPPATTSHKTPSLHRHTHQPSQLLSTDMFNPSMQEWQQQQQHMHKQ